MNNLGREDFALGFVENKEEEDVVWKRRMGRVILGILVIFGGCINRIYVLK